MSIASYLDNNCFRIDEKANTKSAVLRSITYLAKKSPLLKDVSEIELMEELQNRENISTTGFLEGVAIPHCRLKSVKDFTIGLLRAPSGVDFQSFDGKPSQFFFFIISPDDHPNTHIEILSQLSRVLQNKKNLDRLEAAENEEDLFIVVNSLLSMEGEEEPAEEDMSQICITLQKKELFNPLLGLMSIACTDNVQVMDVSGTSAHIRSLPLVGQNRDEKTEEYSVMIQGIVKKSLVNDTIRRIHLICPKEHGQGVLVTAYDLSYCFGSLNY